MFLGSDLKVLISFTLKSGLSMDDVDFSCTFFNAGRKCTFEKSQLIRIDKDNYVACIKASDTGKGKITAEVKVNIPDSDFQGGTRTEIDRVVLKEVIL